MSNPNPDANRNAPLPAQNTDYGAESDLGAVDNIKLSLPMNSAYVSSARLTASSIANRIGFDAEEIEDVKTAVSESCTFIIKSAPLIDRAYFKIEFSVSGGEMGVSLSCGQNIPNVDINKEMGLLMIKALMDEINIGTTDGVFFIEFKKVHKRNVFE